MAKKTRVFGNFRTKIFALLISVGIWFYAQSSLEKTIVRHGIIGLKVPDGYALVYQSVRRIQVRLRGPGPLVEKIPDLPLVYTVRPEDIKDNLVTLDIASRFNELDISLPRAQLVRIKVSAVNGAGEGGGRLRAIISPIVEQKLKVKPVIKGQPRFGFRLDSVDSEPESVLVSGPQYLVEQIKEVETKPVEIWNIDETQFRTLELESEVETLVGHGETVRRKLNLTPDQVRIKVNVAQEEVERTFANVRFRWWVPRDFPFEHEVREKPLNLTVKIKGRRSVVQSVAEKEVVAYIDLSSLMKADIPQGDPRPYKENLRLNFPGMSDVSSWKIEPETVTIWLKNPNKPIE